jgi:hypothetical protein
MTPDDHRHSTCEVAGKTARPASGLVGAQRPGLAPPSGGFGYKRSAMARLVCWVLAGVSWMGSVSPVWAGECPPSNTTFWAWNEVPSGSPANNCLGVTGFRCYPFERRGDWYVRKVPPTCDPHGDSC